jgi:hypothetical protein
MADKMPNKKTSPKAYGERLESSKKWRKDYEDTWRKMAELYRGKQHGRSDYADVATVNVAKSTVDIIFASTTIRAPKMSVYARQPMHEDSAGTVEAVINYWWKRYGVHDEFRAAFKDCLIFGHGWLKTTYRFEEKAEPMGADQIEEMISAQIAEADEFAMAAPEMAGDLPTDQEIVDGVMSIVDQTPNYVVIEDHPQVVRISPTDMFVDPEATSLRDANWVAQRIVRSLDEVRKDKRYKQSARQKLTSTAAISAGIDEDMFGRKRPKNDDVKRVVLFEFYDLEANTFSVFAEGSEDYLMEPTEIPFSFGHPFVQLRNYDVPGDFYPIGEIEPICNLQEELNETRTQLLNHRKKYARKYLALRNALGPDAQAALRSNKDGEVIFIDDNSLPLQNIVQPLQQVSLQGELYNMTSAIHQDIERVSGVNEYMRGNAPQIRRTATEAAILQDAAAARAADKLEIVETAAARVGLRMVQLAQEFLTSEQAARVVSPDGNVSWSRFDRESIQGEYDFEVEAGSTMPRSDSIQRQDAINLLQMMSPFIGQFVNGQELIKMVLRRFGEKEPEKFLMTEATPEMGMAPDPMAQDPMAQDPMAAPSDIPPELLEMLMGGDTSLSGVAGAPQAMDMQGAFDAEIGNSISPEMLAQLAQQMGMRF